MYKTREIKKLQDKGFSKITIDKIENKNTFKTSYERFYKIKKNSIITARFLISIQTSIPSIIRSSKSTICSFYSFDDNEGIDYMTCILSEMDSIILKDKTRTQEIIKIALLESYNDFKNIAYIKELFKKKKLYKSQQDIKINTEFLKNEEIMILNDNLKEPEINGDFNVLIHKCKNIKEVHELKSLLINKLNYLSINIKNIVNEVISKSPITNIYSGITEVSCCSEDADKIS